MRNFPTFLTDRACESLLQSTSTSGTTIGVLNTGSIRIDDIRRVSPFQHGLFSLLVPGTFFAHVLTLGMSAKGSGVFFAFSGISTQDQGKTWLVNGTDVAKTGLNYNVATIEYERATQFDDPSVTLLQKFNITQTRSLIGYLQRKYPPCA